jgi:hypothetical protein
MRLAFVAMSELKFSWLKWSVSAHWYSRREPSTLSTGGTGKYNLALLRRYKVSAKSKFTEIGYKFLVEALLHQILAAFPTKGLRVQQQFQSFFKSGKHHVASFEGLFLKK